MHIWRLYLSDQAKPRAGAGRSGSDWGLCGLLPACRASARLGRRHHCQSELLNLCIVHPSPLALSQMLDCNPSLMWRHAASASCTGHAADTVPCTCMGMHACGYRLCTTALLDCTHSRAGPTMTQTQLPHVLMLCVCFPALSPLKPHVLSYLDRPEAPPHCHPLRSLAATLRQSVHDGTGG